MYEITNPEDQLALLKLITDNTWRAINQQTKQAPALPRPDSFSIPKVISNKSKAPVKLKKAPYAKAPKALSQPKPTPPTAQQIKIQQHKNQQDYAHAVQRTLAKNPPTPMPKSLQPISGNIISPIDSTRSDSDKQELIKQARGQSPVKPL